MDENIKDIIQIYLYNNNFRGYDSHDQMREILYNRPDLAPRHTNNSSKILKV